MDEDGSGDKVSESDLEQAGHAEVDGVQVVPALPLREHDGAHEQVEGHDVQARRRGHDYLLGKRERGSEFIARDPKICWLSFPQIPFRAEEI